MDHLHERLKLEDFELVQAAAEKCEARVLLGRGGVGTFTGAAAGQDSDQGQLRCAAEATAKALVSASEERIALEVLAVKAIDSFDTIIVIVSLSGVLDAQAERLVGSCLIKGDPARGAVLAVLTATNRLLGRVLADAG
jgi:hypothetical protein